MGIVYICIPNMITHQQFIYFFAYTILNSQFAIQQQ
jgi:hypothetical protein